MRRRCNPVIKARISAEHLKEFVGTVGALVDEAKLSVAEGEMTGWLNGHEQGEDEHGASSKARPRLTPLP